MVISDWLID